MPTGSSSGAMTMRAATSVQTTSTPPSSAATGSTFLWSEPTKSRVKCGTMRPTKPIVPLTAIVVPAISEASSTSSLCVRRTSTPSVAALSSPSSSRFSALWFSISAAMQRTSTAKGSVR